MADENNELIVKKENILSVCKYATIECYFKSVQVVNLPAKGISNMLKKERKMWILCTYRSKIGIDMKKVKINIDKSNDVIMCNIPEAEILGKPIIEIGKTKKSDIKIVSNKDGLFIKNPITVSDQNKANSVAKNKIIESVNNNANLFQCARERAKNMIKEYIKKINKICNKEYDIEFKDM